jgi:hypothetical protein
MSDDYYSDSDSDSSDVVELDGTWHSTESDFEDQWVNVDDLEGEMEIGMDMFDEGEEEEEEGSSEEETDFDVAEVLGFARGREPRPRIRKERTESDEVEVVEMIIDEEVARAHALQIVEALKRKGVLEAVLETLRGVDAGDPRFEQMIKDEKMPEKKEPRK